MDESMLGRKSIAPVDNFATCAVYSTGTNYRNIKHKYRYFSHSNVHGKKIFLRTTKDDQAISSTRYCPRYFLHQKFRLLPNMYITSLKNYIVVLI